MPPFLLPLASTALQSIPKMIMGVIQNKMANKIKPVRTPYSVSQYAQNQLGITNQLFNGRMAGASQQEQNILGSQGNTLASINRNATDASSALAMAAAAQGQSNQSLADLRMAEGQNKIGMLGALGSANAAMTNEFDKVYKDKMDKYQEDVQAKAALRQSAMNNFFGGINDQAKMGMAAGMGVFGDLGGNMMSKRQQMGLANGLSLLGVNTFR